MSSPQDPGRSAEADANAAEVTAADQPEVAPASADTGDGQEAEGAEPGSRAEPDAEPDDRPDDHAVEETVALPSPEEPAGQANDPDATPATGLALPAGSGSARPRHAGPPGGYAPSPWQPQPAPALGEHPEVSASDWWASAGSENAEQPAAEQSEEPVKSVPVWLFLVAALILSTVVGVLGFINPGYFVTKVLDQTALQNGVRTVLQNDYRLPNVADVVCPPNQKVLPGRDFDCQVKINNAPAMVRVLIQSKDGRYTVGRPA